MITPDDLPGVDPTLARRIITMARSIAPGLDNLVDGAGDGDPKPRADAIAILIGVTAESVDRGSLGIKQQVMGPARVTYSDLGSWFTDDDRSALRALVLALNPPFNPLGSFPHRDHEVERLWRHRHLGMVEEND